jgi:hypothetical protein
MQLQKRSRRNNIELNNFLSIRRGIKELDKPVDEGMRQLYMKD